MSGKSVDVDNVQFLIDSKGQEHLFIKNRGILIPVDQPLICNKYLSTMAAFKAGRNVQVAGEYLPGTLLLPKDVYSVFPLIMKHKIWTKSDKGELWIFGEPGYVYNEESKEVEPQLLRPARVILVLYSKPIREVDGGFIFFLNSKEVVLRDKHYKLQKSLENLLNYKKSIEDLLNCDQFRCGLQPYDEGLLYDVKAGHWDVFENPEKFENPQKDEEKGTKEKKLIGRDPHKDIKANGVIGIDFGTKSTVVMKQEDNNDIRPVRIGSMDLTAGIKDSDFENPTIISCMNIDKFLEKYEAKSGRPETSCEDLFVSYNAKDAYDVCSPEDFYAYFSNLKQWANREKKDIIVQDKNDKAAYALKEETSREEKAINPIEIYAYYIGLYINNMRNGIYLNYIMSFPVKYSRETKELVRKSFENGLRKSLPKTIVDDTELMRNFSVEYAISEPAAYAVTALEQAGYTPKSEKEQYLYGIFDFGGGTTDFDFGIWRGASDEEYDNYNCDYVLECFGADSDANLGGEHILELLAFEVFKENKEMAARKKFACALPIDGVPFIGGELLINNSQSANRNLTLLKEKLRPLWEQHTNWEEKYKDSEASEAATDGVNTGECIKLQMYGFDGKAVSDCHFTINTKELLELIRNRIRLGVEAFFRCVEKTILNNQAAKYSEQVHIFLAGNSCKSRFVKELFDETIKKYDEEYKRRGKSEAKSRFILNLPLERPTMDTEYVANAKTGVAYGLVKSRPGARIYVLKNYETDAQEEARFKYYLGTERRGAFVCKLSPMMRGEDGNTRTAYNVWHQIQGAGVGVARIYYTENPLADGGLEQLPIANIKYWEVKFEKDASKKLYIRAIAPTVIEYVTAVSEEQIGESEVIRHDFNEC